MPGFQDTTALQTLRTVAISGVLTLILGVIALLFPNIANNFFSRVKQSFSRFAARKTLAIIALFFAAIETAPRANSNRAIDEGRTR